MPPRQQRQAARRRSRRRQARRARQRRRRRPRRAATAAKRLRAALAAAAATASTRCAALPARWHAALPCNCPPLPAAGQAGAQPPPSHAQHPRRAPALQLASAARSVRDAYHTHLQRFGSKQSALFDAGAPACGAAQPLPAQGALLVLRVVPLAHAPPPQRWCLLQPSWRTETQSCPSLPPAQPSTARCAAQLLGWRSQTSAPNKPLHPTTTHDASICLPLNPTTPTPHPPPTPPPTTTTTTTPPPRRSSTLRAS